MAKYSTFFKDFTHCGDLSCPVNCNENSARIFCEICEKWYHYQCRNLTRKAYRELILNNKSFICPDGCNNLLFPFYNLNQLEFLDLLSDNNDTPCKKCKMACLGNGLMNCIQCDVCDHWFHETCVQLDFPFDCYLQYDLDFICSERCQLSILPFHSVPKDADVPDFNPTKDSYPCKLCRNECLGFNLMNCVQCSICHYWLHADCLNLSSHEFDNIANSNLEFICSRRCEMLLFPFHSANFDEMRELPYIDNNITLNSTSPDRPVSLVPKSYTLSNQTAYFDQFLDINCSYLKPDV